MESVARPDGVNKRGLSDAIVELCRLAREGTPSHRHLDEFADPWQESIRGFVRECLRITEECQDYDAESLAATLQLRLPGSDRWQIRHPASLGEAVVECVTGEEPPSVSVRSRQLDLQAPDVARLVIPVSERFGAEADHWVWVYVCTDRTESGDEPYFSRAMLLTRYHRM